MSPPRRTPGGTKHPPHLGQTTPTPNIRNTTMPPHTGKGACSFWQQHLKKNSILYYNNFVHFPPLLDVTLAAVLVPVLVMVVTLILIVCCACHWKNRYSSSSFFVFLFCLFFVVFLPFWLYSSLTGKRLLRERMIFLTWIAQVRHRRAGQLSLPGCVLWTYCCTSVHL